MIKIILSQTVMPDFFYILLLLIIKIKILINLINVLKIGAKLFIIC